MNILFHLAIPFVNAQHTKAFYNEVLGCEIGRESEHAIIFNFAGHQIVTHQVLEAPPEQEGIYPRHFGLIFLEHPEYMNFIKRLNSKQIAYEIPLKTRFSNTSVEHQSFFLKDPSNNLLEFKYYTYPTALFGERDFKHIGDKR